jgi:hypothetical protein
MLAVLLLQRMVASVPPATRERREREASEKRAARKRRKREDLCEREKR